MRDIIAKHNPSQDHDEMIDLLKGLKKIKPKRILEIGIHRGGSLKVWRDIFSPDLLIGIDNKLLDEVKEINHAICLEGVSQDQQIYDEVRRILDVTEHRELDFLFIDGSHYYKDVKKDFEMYAPLVKKGGVIAFHDVIIDDNDTCQVYKFWNEIKDDYETKTISYKDKNGPSATGEGVLLVVEKCIVCGMPTKGRKTCSDKCLAEFRSNIKKYS
jgi:cephalosporin hydroxylase